MLTRHFNFYICTQFLPKSNCWWMKLAWVFYVTLLLNSDTDEICGFSSMDPEVLTHLCVGRVVITNFFGTIRGGRVLVFFQHRFRSYSHYNYFFLLVETHTSTDWNILKRSVKIQIVISIDRRSRNLKISYYKLMVEGTRGKLLVRRANF